MYIFRLFGVAVLIPLISVGLCAKDSGGGGGKGNKLRHLSHHNETGPVTFPAVNTVPDNNATDSISPRRSSFDSMNLDVKPISNSTRVERRLIFDEGEGRGIIYEFLNLSWLFTLLWKAISSYAIVAIVNVLLTPLLKKFGWGGPYWETSINLGSSKADMHQEGSGGGMPPSKGAWGPQPLPPQMHGHQQPGHVGFNPHHTGPGWLSYDQAALAMPYVDKYSMKAAKKAQKYTKKAQKYAHKASKYAAKAQAAKLSMKPLYANGFIHPGAATVPGVPAYGWGK
ncbi:uncharacterized protein LOC110859118 isoform X2 [Folsomia candida]|uniref:uncharacterized protein LOC110859118 isoform X2 n=1 Tax=Folsomia candida TaxID=158441 RepID=UPI000B905003|nr:uncharacterized protein LOC110859118 isoform X2 [Folsomia candida]